MSTKDKCRIAGESAARMNIEMNGGWIHVAGANDPAIGDIAFEALGGAFVSKSVRTGCERSVRRGWNHVAKKVN